MAEALYPYSREEAKREGELEPDTAQFALKQWGGLRVQFVLSNTLCGASTQEFDPDALHWARTACVPPDKTNGEFKIRADSTLLAQFVQQVHAEYQALGMFGPEHCGCADQDYTGKVLVLRPNRLKDECWSAQNQLWLGEMGFGCSPTASGRAVFATCLGDGEKVRWNRTDFMGVLDEQYLPDWAAEKLAELRGPAQEQDAPDQGQADGPAQSGMEMG